ncbi:hypothetical protein P9112_010566 [Eukaryota sp. TZLM1-RC]
MSRNQDHDTVLRDCSTSPCCPTEYNTLSSTSLPVDLSSIDPVADELDRRRDTPQYIRYNFNHAAEARVHPTPHDVTFFLIAQRHSHCSSPSPSSYASSSSDCVDLLNHEIDVVNSPTIPTNCDSTSSIPYFADQSERMLGVKRIVSHLQCSHSLLLTYSGDVYGWGNNNRSQVVYNGPREILVPVKLPLNDIISISTGFDHSLALSSEGNIFGWGRNTCKQINLSQELSLPTTLISIPYSIKEVFAGHALSFALTQEGQVLKWGCFNSLELICGLNNIITISVYGQMFVAVDGHSNFFCYVKHPVQSQRFQLTQIPVTSYLTLKSPANVGSFFLVASMRKSTSLFIIDVNGDVWQFKMDDTVPFNNEPTKVDCLTNIAYIGGFHHRDIGIFAIADIGGNVSAWGRLPQSSDVYVDINEPICFTNRESIAVGGDFLFAYNNNSVWAWGNNHKGQLGTGDLMYRRQPVKVFGSEILGSFRYPKQHLNRMFSVLIKRVYWEYLNYLQELFGNHPYVKARFYTKSCISKRVAQFAREVFTDHPIQNSLILKDPQKLEVNENICDLQLQLSTVYNGPNVINTRIKKLDVYCDGVDYDPQLLFMFPNVEVVKFGGICRNYRSRSINMGHLSNLKIVELAYPLTMTQLPTSLVKLVVRNMGFESTDLSYLTSLKELMLFSRFFSARFVTGEIPLPQSILRLKLYVCNLPIQFQFPNLKELILHRMVPTNITEQIFPSLKFIQLIEVGESRLSGSSLSSVKFKNQGLIESVTLIKNEYLVELSCFPWWIQYPAYRYLIDLFGDFVNENKQQF